MMNWFNLITIIWAVFVGVVAFKNRKATIALLIAALPLYLIRLQIFSIPTTWLEIAIYTAVIVEIFRANSQNGLLLWFAPLIKYIIPLSLIFSGLVIGTVVSDNPITSLGVIKGWFIDPILLFVLINNAFKNNYKVAFRFIYSGLWLSAFGLSVVAIYQVISGDFITIDNRASSWFSSANYLSLYLAPIIVLGVSWINSLKNKKYLGVAIVSQIIIVAALYFTYSYASWIAVAVGLTVWLVMSKQFIYVWGSLASFGLLIASQWQSLKFQQMFDFIDRSSSHVRVQIWQTAQLMIKENWFFGIGLGQFQNRYVSFAERLFHPPLEFLVLHAHNMFLYFWINAGILGFVGILWLLQQWFNKLKNVPKDPVVIGVIASMVTLLIHGLFDNAYWKNDLSTLFWVITGLGVLIINQNEPKSIPNRN